MRKLWFAGALGLMAWAAAAVPLPFVTLAPVPAQPVTSIMELADSPQPLSGKLLFTAVAVRPVTAAGGLAAWSDPDREVILQQKLIPERISPEEFARRQQRIFAESLQVSAAVGLRQAGRQVKVSGEGARVVATLPGAPAEGELRQGDVVVSAEGQPIRLAAELVTAVGALQPGQKANLTVVRGGQRRQLAVPVRPLAQLHRAGLGVLVETVNQRIRLPVDVRVKRGVAVGGPSAGLMMALTVYDLVDPVDLTRGRVVAGTGTVDVGGTVGPVGGIAEKIRGAELEGAEVFLVPTSEAKQAAAAAPEGMRVIGVDTVEQAITALRSGR